jgi:hypothetical protein
MLKVVGTETAQDEVDGRFLLDEIARKRARRMLVAGLETEVTAYSRPIATNATATVTPWSFARAKGALAR